MSRLTETDERYRRMAARTALRGFSADMDQIIAVTDPVELLGQLLAGLHAEARAAAGGSDQLWDDATAVMRRVVGEAG
jgi:hypothetical protein